MWTGWASVEPYSAKIRSSRPSSDTRSGCSCVAPPLALSLSVAIVALICFDAPPLPPPSLTHLSQNWQWKARRERRRWQLEGDEGQEGERGAGVLSLATPPPQPSSLIFHLSPLPKGGETGAGVAERNQGIRRQQMICSPHDVFVTQQPSPMVDLTSVYKHPFRP